MKLVKTRARYLTVGNVALLLAVVALFVFTVGQVGIASPPFMAELNAVIEAAAVDSVESDFILGASNGRLPTPLVPFPVVSGALTIESSDVRDDIGDIGAREIFVEAIYEGAAGVFTIEQGVVILDGLTLMSTILIDDNGVRRIFTVGEPIPVGAVVISVQGIRRIRRMVVFAVGDQEIDQPQGVVTAYVGGVPCSEILPGRGRSMVAVWTTGPTSPEQINAVNATFVASGVGGMDWEVASAVYSRGFAMGHPWVVLLNIRAREPQVRAGSSLTEPFPLPPLVDLRYRIEGTSGAIRTIDFSAQITGVE